MMSTGVMCSVVQIAQHPPPVHIPLERVALPNPIPSQHAPRRTATGGGGGGGASARDLAQHGGFRWHRPAFQPFQLKPWIRDHELEEELKESLAVISPNAAAVAADLPRNHHGALPRSFTAPPATVSSLEGRRGLGGGWGLGGGKLSSPPKTAKSSVSLRSLITPNTKRSVATFPARPPLSKGKQIPGRFFPKPMLTEEQRKQIPGRFFPKPMLTEEQRLQLELYRRMKPVRKAASIHSAAPSGRTAAESPDRADRADARVDRPDRPDRAAAGHMAALDSSSASVSRMDRQQSPGFNQRIALTRQQLNKELKSEVFAICFNPNLDMVHSTTYDPHSELHSDYYTIKRLKVPAQRLGRPVKTCPDDFAVVLRGHSKHLHKKFLLNAESMESLAESYTVQQQHQHHQQQQQQQQPTSSAATRSGGSPTKRMTFPAAADDGESPRKVIDIQTPKTGPQSEASAGEQEQDNTLAPLNSPTGTGTDLKDGAFPALV